MHFPHRPQSVKCTPLPRASDRRLMDSAIDSDSAIRPKGSSTLLTTKVVRAELPAISCPHDSIEFLKSLV